MADATSITYNATPVCKSVDELIAALANPSPMANPDFADISAKGRELIIRELENIKAQPSA